MGFLANVVRLYRGEELDFLLGDKEASAKINEVFGTKPSTPTSQAFARQRRAAR